MQGFPVDLRPMGRAQTTSACRWPGGDGGGAAAAAGAEVVVVRRVVVEAAAVVALFSGAARCHVRPQQSVS